ncbi:MAG: hypothetical protein ACJ763_06400 [Bdellovibrionia bacterium]
MPTNGDDPSQNNSVKDKFGEKYRALELQESSDGKTYDNVDDFLTGDSRQGKASFSQIRNNWLWVSAALFCSALLAFFTSCIVVDTRGFFPATLVPPNLHYSFYAYLLLAACALSLLVAGAYALQVYLIKKGALPPENEDGSQSPGTDQDRV